MTNEEKIMELENKIRALEKRITVLEKKHEENDIYTTNIMEDIRGVIRDIYHNKKPEVRGIYNWLDPKS